MSAMPLPQSLSCRGDLCRRDVRAYRPPCEHLMTSAFHANRSSLSIQQQYRILARRRGGPRNACETMREAPGMISLLSLVLARSPGQWHRSGARSARDLWSAVSSVAGPLTDPPARAGAPTRLAVGLYFLLQWPERAEGSRFGSRSPRLTSSQALKGW